MLCARRVRKTILKIDFNFLRSAFHERCPGEDYYVPSPGPTKK